ncbi:MAG: S8 family serine peptidase [Bacteroidota bacterium]
MRLKLCFVLLLLTAWGIRLNAQKISGEIAGQEALEDKYWVFLTDKGDFSKYEPGEILSERALERRARMNIALDETDYPVVEAYVQAIGAVGATVRHPSKWFNAVSVKMDAATRAKVEALPFVKSVRAIPKVKRDLEPLQAMRVGYDVGFTGNQLTMLGLDQLHQNGYNGTGVLIAVMDNGFSQVNENPYLNHLFLDDRVLATYDFVNDEVDVYNQGSHGHWVLTIMAGWYEEEIDPNFNFYGSAHGATYILCHTEDDQHEWSQEEDNWVAAMEYADSLGADVFNTSLGYRDLDNDNDGIFEFDYGYEGMDGNTTIITRGADRAAAKGIVVVNSAGNSGQNKISAPADGDSVIAVGAVDSLGVIAGFSSRGPSFDGRIKPDVCAMGRQTSYVRVGGGLAQGNGTSFSSPMIAGLLACILQAPNTGTNMQLYDALIRSSHLYETPDSNYGYGIPNGPMAFDLFHGEPLQEILDPASFSTDGIDAFPVPTDENLYIAVDNEVLGFSGDLELWDSYGRLINRIQVEVAPFYNLFRLQRSVHYPNAAGGRYVVRIRDRETKLVRYTKRVVILDH